MNAYPADAFSRSGAQIIAGRAGIYKIEYTINVPACEELCAAFRLLVDNRPVPSSIVSVEHPAGEGGTIAHAQALVCLNRGASIRLNASTPFCLTAANPDFALATLSIERICDE